MEHVMERERVERTEIEDHRAFFANHWQQGAPVFKLYRTDAHGYLYDTGTSKVVMCEDEEYRFLDYLSTAPSADEGMTRFVDETDADTFVRIAGQIRAAIEQENILITRPTPVFGAGVHFSDLERIIQTDLWVLLLEVTEICNLRCAYCTYGDHYEGMRAHGTRNMSQDTAFRSLDYLRDHAGRRKDVAITFYGGEPLVAYDLIRECVDYAEQSMPDKRVDYFMTTNGTLVTEERAAFLAAHDFSVSVSIDGPREVHDYNRRDVAGKGSFERAVRGLKHLVDAYGDRAEKKLRLSMVYAPPYREGKVDRVAELWEEFPWIPRNLECRISYPGTNTIDPSKYAPEDLEGGQNLWKWAQADFKQKRLEDQAPHPFTKANLENELAGFVQRPVFAEPPERYWLNGCCVPGGRKLYVTVDGELRACERISSDSPALGHIETGIDMDLVRKHYVHDFADASIPGCSQCWNRRLCGMCYVKATGDDGQWDTEAKKINCLGELQTKESILTLYSEMMEKNPDSIEYLYDLELE